MRCFIAVDLDEALIPQVSTLQNQVKNYRVKTIDPANLHFTLKFLGEIDQNLAKEVKQRLSEVASKTARFEISIAGLGVFPNENFIRVVWAGAKNGHFLDLHLEINRILVPLFKPEKPIPHLTLARAKDGLHNTNILNFVRQNSAVEIGKMWVKNFKLKKSSLTREGPIYEDLEKFELR